MKYIDAWKLAHLEPADGSEGLVSDLDSSLATLPEVPNPLLEVRYVDRKLRKDHKSKGLDISIVSAIYAEKTNASHEITVNTKGLQRLRKRNLSGNI